jgi:hypothetical protein
MTDGRDACLTGHHRIEAARAARRFPLVRATIGTVAPIVPLFEVIMNL